MDVEVRRQLLGNFLLPYRIQRSNSSSQAWQQNPLIWWAIEMGQMWYSYLFLFFLSSYFMLFEYSVCMNSSSLHECSASRGQKRVLDSVRLELQMVVSCECREWKPGPVQGSQGSDSWVTSPVLGLLLSVTTRSHSNPSCPRTVLTCLFCALQLYALSLNPPSCVYIKVFLITGHSGTHV